jgi:hypothetical protein
VCGRLMSPAQETQSMQEIRLLRGRLPRKGGGLTGIEGGRWRCGTKQMRDSSIERDVNRCFQFGLYKCTIHIRIMS